MSDPMSAPTYILLAVGLTAVALFCFWLGHALPIFLRKPPEDIDKLQAAEGESQ